LHCRALVAPDQGRTNEPAILIEQDRTVHLAGKPNTRDGIGGNTGVANRLLNRDGRRPPPVSRILFRPTRLGTPKGLVFGRSRRENLTAIVHDNRARSASTDIDPEEVDRSPSFRSEPRISCASRLGRANH
jgi:hypothetical protein